jgi:hypothetical protein
MNKYLLKKKNNRHYFLGSLPTIWLKVVKWFWCHFLQANIIILGISKTFQMHLKPIVSLTVIMSPFHAVFMFTWWLSSFPTTITTHRWYGYCHFMWIVWIHVYIHNFTPSKQELHMKHVWWFQGLWKQSILADTLVHLAAQNQKKWQKWWF